VIERLESRRLLAFPAFLLPAQYTTGSRPSSPIAADFNGDSKLDMAVANVGDNSISLLMNNGSGTFAPRVDYAIGRSFTSFTAADLNGDGKADLALTFDDGLVGTLRVLLNNGDGTFALAGDQPVGNVTPSSLQAGEFNGDGRTDLAFITSGQSGGVNVLLNNGQGSFASPVEYFTRPNATFLATQDLNGDDKGDLAVVSASDNSVRVLLNRGDGTFVATADYLLGDGFGPRGMATADFDGNGRTDLAIARDGLVQILLNEGNGTFAPAVSYRINKYLSALYTTIAAADFSGDGRPDIATQSLTSSYNNSFTLVLNKGDGTFAAPIDYPFGSTGAQMTTGDFNSDGRADLAWVNSSFWGAADRLVVRMNAGASIFAPRTDYPGGTRPQYVVAGDFFSDGKTDLITFDYFLNNGNGQFTPTYLTAGRPQGIPVGAADFDRDGRSDIVVATTGILGVQLGKGDGTFGPVVNYLTSSGNYYPGFQQTIGDFNGDGAPDIAATVYQSTSLTVLLNDGHGAFVPAGNYPFSGQMTASDLNGDGSVDLAVSVGAQVQLLLNNGNGTFTPGGSYTAGPGAFATADFDGNGRRDIAVSGFGGLWVLLNLGHGTFATTSHAYAGGSIDAADFNEDGRADLAVTDLPGQNLKLLLNNGRGEFNMAVSYATGGYPTSIIAAELNGDGKPDLAWVNQMSNSLSVMLDIAPPTLRRARFQPSQLPPRPSTSELTPIMDSVDGLRSDVDSVASDLIA
jgi:hypothetical protein